MVKNESDPKHCCDNGYFNDTIFIPGKIFKPESRFFSFGVTVSFIILNDRKFTKSCPPFYVLSYHIKWVKTALYIQNKRILYLPIFFFSKFGLRSELDPVLEPNPVFCLAELDPV